MKISFEKGTKEYIGNVVEEYKCAGLLQNVKESKRVKELIAENALLPKELQKNISLELRKHSITIDLNNSRLYKFATEVYDSNYKDVDYRYIVKDIIYRQVRTIDIEDYEAIKNVLLEDKFIHFQSYIDDFALLVIYAINNNSHSRKMNIDVREEVCSPSERERIKQFYTSIAKGEIDINRITLTYNKSAVKSHGSKLHIESSLLMKIMLYEFGRKFYSLFLKLEDDEWEEYVKQTEDGKEKEKEKLKYRKDFKSDTNIVRSVLKLFVDFTNKELMFRGLDNAKSLSYELIGKLLVIAGYQSYSEYCEEKTNMNRKISYKTENDYFLKKFTKLLTK